MSLMVGRWLRSLTSKKAEQDPSCAILRLPVEMILLIFEQLPQYQRIILAQTCSSLRAIFIDNYKAREDGGQPLSSGQLGIDQRSRFLFTMAYSQPNLLACHQCMKLHTIDQEDTPSSWWQSSCRHEEGSPMDIVRWSEEYVTFHRHVQLALKYTRLLKKEGNGGPVLQRKYKGHLNNLLQPFSMLIDTRVYAALKECTGTYSVLPKVVDGQYIIQSTWKFEKTIEDVSQESLGYLHICQHQITLSAGDPWIRSLPQALRYQARRDCCRAWGPVARRLRVEIAINDAFETGEEMVGSCYGCETDFAVQASSETTVVRAWSNLGSETTFLDNQSWQSMAKFGESSRGSHSLPGSVRQLYEQGAISGYLSEE